jgi:ATP-dependent helicase HrpB
VIGVEDRLFLLQQICLGCYSAKDIRDQPVWPWLKAWLSAGQEALMDQYAPAHLILPNGRRGHIHYALDTPPVLSARIQDLYDLDQMPMVAMGRQPLTVAVLGPNQRPLQITQDLAGFWQTTYPELKQTLQKRYPKHEWR